MRHCFRLGLFGRLGDGAGGRLLRRLRASEAQAAEGAQQAVRRQAMERWAVAYARVRVRLRGAEAFERDGCCTLSGRPLEPVGALIHLEFAARARRMGSAWRIFARSRAAAGRVAFDDGRWSAAGVVEARRVGGAVQGK